MTIHDLLAREDIRETNDIDTDVKPSPWGFIAVVLVTIGFWAYVFALARVLF